MEKVKYTKWPAIQQKNPSETDPFNSSPPSAAYMRQWIGSTLVQIVACRLFDTKPLSKPMQGYYQLGTNFSEILIEMQNLSFMKMHLKISSAK